MPPPAALAAGVTVLKGMVIMAGATEAQMTLINALRAEWVELTRAVAHHLGEEFSEPLWVQPTTRMEASQQIGKGVTAVAVAKEKYESVFRAEFSEGMWTIGERIFKVQESHGSGRLYAKELIDGRFEYAPGALRDLRTKGVKMTLEKAVEYGRLYGICCVCGRTLTDETSVAAGIGPVCSAKF